MNMSLKIETDFASRKDEILAYLRSRASEFVADIAQQFGASQFRKLASAINRALATERNTLASVILQTADREQWSQGDKLRAILLLKHCTNVLILETRHEAWQYEYMAFSRRIGELWEPFVTTCFDFPVRDDVALYVPPLFSDIRERLSNEVRDFIAQLPISDEDKESLTRYYDQVWQLVTSGEIKLELDLHFENYDTRYVVDCKSGFGSNEKGNTNRLLLVASVYKNIEPEDYRCLILVRSKEDENNHYLQTLKNSGLWEVSCGADTYARVKELSGFDLGAWMKNNVTWEQDLSHEFIVYLQEHDLFKYLTW